MSAQEVSSFERSGAKSRALLAEGRVGEAQKGRCTASLKQKRVNYRRFEVVTMEGDFVVEYYGQGMARERVLVNGQVAGRGRSTWWYAPHFRFRIGSADAVLAVHFSPWLTIRWLKLIVDGRIVYSEGAAGRALSVDELLTVLSDPLASQGIQVGGGSVPVPTNVVCEKKATHITLTERWFSWTSVVMAPFCILSDAAVVGVYALMPKGDIALPAFLALLPGILLALWASYYVLARLVNRTVVRVTASELSLRHGPLPWPGNRSLLVQHVKEFHCGQRASRNYAGDVWETYTLNAVLEDGRQVELLHKIGSPGAAHLLGQQVTGWLAAV
jgi:hypothetical protein